MAYSFLMPTAAITLVLLVFAPALSVASVILDVDGDILQNGGMYYILPKLLGTGGLTVNTSAPCPLDISQARYSRGSPVRIYSPYKSMFLSTSFEIIFSFDGVTATCNKPLRWWVAPKDANNNSYVIVGTDGPFEPTYAFKIEEAKSGKYVYNIKFCRTIKSYRVSTMECDDVTFLEDGLLGVVPDAPYPVSFAKTAPLSAAYV